jgi:hypothetical protein
LRKRIDEWIAKDSPLSEQAAEAGFGELQYLDEGPVKAGAYYTGIARKSEEFFRAKVCANSPALCASGKSATAPGRSRLWHGRCGLNVSPDPSVNSPVNADSDSQLAGRMSLISDDNE